jgi:hypothetical protein
MKNQRSNDNVPREREEQEETSSGAGLIANQVMGSQDKISQITGEQPFHDSIEKALKGADNRNTTLADSCAGSEPVDPQLFSSMPTQALPTPLTDDSKVKILELKEFTLLPKLCPELRILIWRLAMGPRLIEVIHTARRRDYDVYVRMEKAPALFFVCHEARVEVIKLYKPMKDIDGMVGTTWCNLKEDTSCFRSSRLCYWVREFFENMPEETCASIRRIALCMHTVNRYWPTVGSDVLLLLPGLEDVYVTDNYIFHGTDDRQSRILELEPQPEHEGTSARERVEKVRGII